MKKNTYFYLEIIFKNFFLLFGIVSMMFLFLTVKTSYAKELEIKEVVSLYFSQNSIDKMDENYIRINGERLIPPFDFQNREYNTISLNTLRPLEISVGSETQVIHLDELSADQFISLHVGGYVYKVYTAMPGMPGYDFKSFEDYKGDLYVTPSSVRLEVPAYAYIIDNKGKLIYYRANETPLWTLSNFNKHVLENGHVRYSLFRQFNNMTPLSYFFGEEIIMDENFKVIDRVQLLPAKGRKGYPVENHAFVILGDNHYIVTGYYHTQIDTVPWTNKKLAAAVIQEIKDDKVIFDWFSADFPELYETCMDQCNAEHIRNYQDYLHLNSVFIDPMDNHLIVSLAMSSQILKVDRTTGKILWKLGGLKSDFNLKNEHYFLRQHDAQIVKDGWLILLDNRFMTPLIKRNLKGKSFLQDNLFSSRIVAFKLDEKNKEITDFKELPLHTKIQSMGSVQLLQNGHFLVGYGSHRDIAAKEINLKGDEFMSLSLNKPYTSYKVYKYERSNE